MNEKTRAELDAAIRRGKEAEHVLERLQAQAVEEQARDLTQFKSMSGAQRTDLYRTNPERYRELAQQWRDTAEQDLLTRGSR